MASRTFPVYSCLCYGCPEKFIWTPEDDPKQKPPSFHSPECEAAHERRLLESMPVKCPRPDKAVYRDVEFAEACAYDEWVRPYRCVCGGIHLGHPSIRIIRHETRALA